MWEGESMATPVIMPRQGQSVESCIISKWYKKKGDSVKAGDVLFSYETDKAAFEEEAPVAGVLLEILFKQDDDVPVLSNVCIIGEAGENINNSDPPPRSDVTYQQSKVEEKDNSLLSDKHESVSTGSKNTSENIAFIEDSDTYIKISPRAKNYAQKIGADYRQITPTGPEGRIIERDIINAKEKGEVFTPAAWADYANSQVSIQSGTGLGGRVTVNDIESGALSEKSEKPSEKSLERASENPLDVIASGSHDAVAPEKSSPEFEEIKLSNIRKVIARTMHESLSNAAQLTLNSSFDATVILKYREQIKKFREISDIANITLNDIILYAVSRTLIKYKYLNAHYIDDRIHLYTNVHLGVATDTERGLMVPTVYNANLKSLSSISYEVKSLVDTSRKGTINPDLLKGGTFTVTNLGTLDIESFTPILNPPQTGILGVNSITQKVKEVNGSYEYYPAMGLSLTFDHRALDGAIAARFLKELKLNLENFTVLLAG